MLKASKTHQEPKIKKVTFPHMGNYYIAFETIAKLLADEVIVPPAITKKTLELGTKHGPESACVPFKYNLGNFIESLDMGANILVQANGGCRFGYYKEVQEEILHNLGYEFEFVELNNVYNFVRTAIDFKKSNSNLTYSAIARAIALAYRKARAIEFIEDIVRKNIGFETTPGQFENAQARFLRELRKSASAHEVKKALNKYQRLFADIKINKPKKPLRVGIVGELYVLMEPFSNFDIEKQLGKKGIEVHRFCTVSSILHNEFSLHHHTRQCLKYAKPYLNQHIGAHGTESVGLTHKLIKDGFDGIIHIKPFGCMPEVNAMTALHRISKDYKFPIIYFSFDSQTSETGIKTRLEAFHDMLIMKHDKATGRKK